MPVSRSVLSQTVRLGDLPTPFNKTKTTAETVIEMVRFTLLLLNLRPKSEVEDAHDNRGDDHPDDQDSHGRSIGSGGSQRILSTRGKSFRRAFAPVQDFRRSRLLCRAAIGPHVSLQKASWMPPFSQFDG